MPPHVDTFLMRKSEQVHLIQPQIEPMRQPTSHSRLPRAAATAQPQHVVETHVGRRYSPKVFQSD
jgi:hypothetical protein